MEQIKLKNKKEYEQGVACAILCAVLWGFLPIYWKRLEPIDPLLILFCRIVLSFLFALVLALYFYRWDGIVRPLKEKGIIPTFFFAGILISFNWGTYIWAIANGHVIQTCIGYYIEPLFVCIFGILFFKERMSRYKLAAFLLACAGVFVILIYYHEIPVIALSLGLSFAVYTAIKKKVKLDAVLSLLYETMMLVPVALIATLYLAGKGAAAGAGLFQWGLLALAGILTGTPLMLFAMAANRIPMITLGIIEYISPSITLLLGIFLFKEPFELVRLITFGMIWIGLVIFTIGEIRESKAAGSEPIINESKAAESEPVVKERGVETDEQI